MLVLFTLGLGLEMLWGSVAYVEESVSAARELVLNHGKCQGPVAREHLCLKKKREAMGSTVAGGEVRELWACGHYRDSAASTVLWF